MAKQEQQNVALRTELLMADHPRWRLIPSFEFISVIDLSRLCKIIQQDLHPRLFGAKPLEDDEELEKLYD